jgi:hypothetical protein
MKRVYKQVVGDKSAADIHGQDKKPVQQFFERQIPPGNNIRRKAGTHGNKQRTAYGTGNGNKNRRFDPRNILKIGIRGKGKINGQKKDPLDKSRWRRKGIDKKIPQGINAGQGKQPKYHYIKTGEKR